ncbi:MAG TPA: NTP transferase domain-containing protein [Candidatus Acidoferrum sp.]|nr:NTP transferase domain-containing protein [Candidatus Acidoferrum sp.]
MEICAVIAAAGMSSRMGEFKPMLTIGSISVAQRIVATLRQAGVSKIVVVTGHNADALERHLSKSGAVFLRNENYRTTQMFDSARIGLSYILDKCDAALFTPVDIPLFTAGTVRKLMKSGADYACPVCCGQRGHPILLSRNVIQKVLEDSGEGGLAGALARCGIPEAPVEVEDRGVLFDADTPEDFDVLLDYHNSQLVRPVVKVALARELPFFDERIAMLLRLIEETSSVHAACRRMQMSYSAGWNTINGIESQLGYRLVERSHGGSGGGSSRLSPEGTALLQRFDRFNDGLKRQAERLYDRYFSDIF